MLLLAEASSLWLREPLFLDSVKNEYVDMAEEVMPPIREAQPQPVLQ